MNAACSTRNIACSSIASTFGIGLLIGLAGGGLVRPKRLGPMLLTSIAIIGAGVASLAIAPTLIVACVSLLIGGLTQGFLGVQFFSWIQKRVAPDMMGRVMSVLGLASVGLTPISSAIAGALANYSIPFMFLVSGIILVIIAFAMAASSPALRSLRAGK